ncbi:MAG: phage/plasmid primase, P4 family, partial [Phycisphaerales bacterium]|nr:phage/plasmid primase, P4 family [Phycisphaerales bacterium]
GIVQEAVLHILHGIGANGKSVFTELALHIMGDYGMAAPPKLLIARQHDAHPTELADLRAMRFVASMESGEGQRFDEERIKKLTGSDTIKGRYMHKDFIEFQPTHKLFMATNHRPEISGTDHAIWRRPKLWPFDVIFSEPKDSANPQPGEQDRRLLDTLKGEASGVLGRWVRGSLEWQRIGLSPPSAVTAATADYKVGCDRLQAFIEERCVAGKGLVSLKVGASELYAAYKAWAENGIEYALNQKRFGTAMKERGFTKGEPDMTTRRATYEGISLAQ